LALGGGGESLGICHGEYTFQSRRNILSILLHHADVFILQRLYSEPVK
jgi:hypothetical protein